MKTIKLTQNLDLKEISSSELYNIHGGNLVAVASLAVAAFKLALDVSYNLGYAVGYYAGGN